MTREVYHCLEPSCQLRFVRQSAYDKHIEKHINNGLYLPDVTAAGLRKAQGAPPPSTYRATLTTTKKATSRSARSPSHLTLADKKRARQSAHAAQAAQAAKKQKLDGVSKQEQKRHHRQKLLVYKPQAMTTRPVTDTKRTYRKDHRHKDTPGKDITAVQGGRSRRRRFRRIASGSIGIPHPIKGKTAVVDLRSPSRSRSPSIAMDLPDFDHGTGDGIGSSRGVVHNPTTIADRTSHPFTPEPTPPPTPISHAHPDEPNLEALVSSNRPHTPPTTTSALPSGPITPDSSTKRVAVAPTWSISPRTTVASVVGRANMPEDRVSEEPIGQLFARMLKERDELDDDEDNKNEADDEGMASEADDESSIVSSDSGIDDDGHVDIDPPQASTPIPISVSILTPPSVNRDRQSPPPPVPDSINKEDADEPVKEPPPVPEIEIIEILDTDTESESQKESEVDEWDLFDVENQIFGYRVPGGHVSASTTVGVPHLGVPVPVPKSPFKGLSPRRLRPSELDGPRR